jgi:hypothetical protein
MKNMVSPKKYYKINNQGKKQYQAYLISLSRRQRDACAAKRRGKPRVTLSLPFLSRLTPSLSPPLAPLPAIGVDREY